MKTYQKSEKKIEKRHHCHGFTLLEVIVALLITGILLFLTLRLVVSEWKQEQEIKDSLEMEYSLTVGSKKVSDAVRTAQSVRWSGKRLEIIPWSNQVNPATDLYYIADKDSDGIQDLYWEHLGVPNPLASHMVSFICTELEPDLWQIDLQTSLHNRTRQWELKISQRAIREELP